MAIPVYRGRGNQVSSTAPITPTPVVGHAANDIDILPVHTANQAVTLSVAAGFALLTTTLGQGVGSAANAVLHTIFWRRWNGTDGNPTVADSGSHQQTSMMSFSGCITAGDPWDVFSLSQDVIATTSGASAGLITTVPDCLVVLFTAGTLPNADTSTEFSGWANNDLVNVTEINDRTRLIGGNGGSYGACSGEKATAGSVGQTTFTTVTSCQKDHALIAFRGPTGAVSGVSGVYNHTRRRRMAS